MSIPPHRSSIASIALVLWSVLLSLAWLIPHHFPPWSSFHLDAWMGLMMILATLVAFWKSRGGVQWTGAAAGVGALVLLPGAQWVGGLIELAGEAWTTSLYLLGWLLAILTGIAWESRRPGQAFDALGSALLIAASVSIGLQMVHWLQLVEPEITDTWTMGLMGTRPYANLGQPNQLATVLVWALLAVLWFYTRGILSWACSMVACAFVLIGIALTQSRTGSLEVLVVAGTVFVLHRLWPARNLRSAIWLLLLFYAGCALVLPHVREALLLDQDTNLERYTHSNQQRISAWLMFAQAALERPWLGFGWTPIRHVQIMHADETPAVGAVFSSAHNVVLDAALWIGLPLTVLVCALFATWFWKRIRAVTTAEDAVLLLLLVAVMIHAMLEFPLQYAYLLLPAGLVMGILEVRQATPVLMRVGRATMLGLAAIAACALALTARDYLRIEREYVTLRMETAGLIQAIQAPEPPDVLVLTQFKEWFRFARFSSHAGMKPDEIAWLETVSKHYPTPSALFRMAVTLVLNDRTDEAAPWLKRLCHSTDERTCNLYRSAWEREAQSNAKVASVPWPD